MPLVGATNLNFGVENAVSLNSGQMYTLGPEPGWYKVVLDKNHVVQFRDPIAQIWRGKGSANTGALPEDIYSDGVNVRIVNLTGCAVGALLTNAGSGYTSAPTVTASAGGSLWRAIVGGAVSTSVTVTSAGQNYTFPPTCVIDAPPTGGLQATAYCTLSSGTISSVTIVDQGAGYLSPPSITFVNDPRELNPPQGSSGITVGYGAAAALALTGAQTVTGLVETSFGNTSVSSLPTLTFSGGGGSSAAATVLMAWTITAFAAGTAGAGLSGSFARITAEDSFPTTSPAYTNPSSQKNLVFTRPADIKAAISGGGITTTGSVIYDGGLYTSVPTPLVLPTASVVTTAPVVTFTMGGAAGVSFIMRVA